MSPQRPRTGPTNSDGPRHRRASSIVWNPVPEGDRRSHFVRTRRGGMGAGLRKSEVGKSVSTLTAGDRVDLGRAARSTAPRSSHADYEPGPTRPDPIALLEQQEKGRVADLIPIRYGRMLESPFAFFRGAAVIMAADLAASPRSGQEVQLCGDAHVSNFGLFGSPERNLVFDVNDFDETLPGPWEWDVKRLAASLAVAGRENEYGARQRKQVVLAGVRAYRLRMRE